MKQFSIPSGFKDLIMGECNDKKQLQLKIEKVLDAWGYREIVTPSIEYFETYRNGFENIDEQQMFKFTDRKGRLVMLRADMTVPIARLAATKLKDSPLPLRLRYCASVYKDHEELGGQLNEMSDCGVELIGVDEKSGDLEILATALEVMESLEKNFTLEIGNVNFFKTACRLMDLTIEQINDLAELIGKKRLIELDEYLNDLKINDTYKHFFKALPWLSGNDDILDEIRSIAFDDQLLKIVDSIALLGNQIKLLGYNSTLSYDFSKLDNLDYYTGLMFEAYVEGVGFRVLSGGRYDNLIAKFGQDIPAVGFSIKLDSLINENATNELVRATRISYPDNLQIEAMKQAQQLRKSGKIVELLCDNTLSSIKTEVGEATCCE